jgi:hypothetical protein
VNAAPTSIRTTVLAVVSLLDDAPGRSPATRTSRDRSVLAHTIERIANARGVDRVVVLAWDDQAADVATIDGAELRVIGPRRPTIAMRARAAALRWSDGWRGGLLNTTEFDRGFHAEATLAAMDAAACGAALLVNASAALIDADALSRLIDHHAGPAARHEFAFAAGAPGSGAMIVGRDLIDRLRREQCGPGSLLTYHPDRAQHDPLAKEPSLPVPAVVARSMARLTLDSDRQSHRLSLAQADAPSLAAADRIVRLASRDSLDATPREVTLELTTRRATRPTWSLLSKYAVDRPDLTLDAARRTFDELSAVDDIRLTLAGVGDPLLHAELPAILAAARERGIRAIHVETDLLPASSAILGTLVDAVDVVSVHLPALARETYSTVMRADRMSDVLANMKALLIERNARGALPILVPTFVKLAANLGEMEAWYDQWLRAVGAAVIAPPSDFGGVIDYAGVADMTPPARGACRSLRSRLAVLCDGTIVACEQDLLGRRSLGKIGDVAIADAWTRGMTPMRDAHVRGDWSEAGPTCVACRMWDRS